MEFGFLDLKSAATRLHMDELELKHFAQREEVPAQKRGDDFFFDRRLLDEWAQRLMIGLHPKQLTGEHTHAMNERAKSTGEIRISDLLPIEAIAPAISAKNKGGVLLRVDAQALLKVLAALDVSGAAGASAGETVLHAARRTVVTGGDEVVGLHDHGGDLTPRAVRTFGDHLRDLHEIFVPAGARIDDLFLFHGRYCSTFSPASTIQGVEMI